MNKNGQQRNTGAFLDVQTVRQAQTKTMNSLNIFSNKEEYVPHIAYQKQAQVELHSVHVL